jgi:ABC-type amino acid transport substrate-binding protein
MGLTTSIGLSISADLVKALDLAEARVPLVKTYTAALTHGVLAGQGDLVFHDSRTIAPSANDDLDLAGVLLDPVGTLLTFVRVKALIVAAWTTNANNVVIGAAGANQWVGLLNATGTITLKPGGVQAYFAGQADAVASTVVAATGDILRVANSGAGTSVTYDIIIVGASA